MKSPWWMQILKWASIPVLVAAVSACGGTGGGNGPNSVTVYSADGLGRWYQARFQEFSQITGISVNLVEAGSAEVVSRIAKEKANPQADLLVTLPPFVQKAAGSGLLVGADIDIAAVDQKNRDRDGRYVAIVDNYLTFIAHPAAALKDARWDDLLDPRLRGKLQYSTPGQAGDGTAMLVLLQHLMGDQGAIDYLSRLQHNNVGPSSSTGKLQPKVSNGELWVANGDLQMNLASIREDRSNFSIFIPAARDGKRSTISLPYVAAVTNGAPHAENARKLLAHLLSVPVQRTIPREALGMPVRADVQPEAGANTPAQVLEGVHIWHPDWDQVVSTLDASLIAYHQETGS
ncbi:2-aminoethylphosphonate ABC transporter substrate-binding protein [Mycobacteroides abscessus subsp. massiliense]|nr:2-aminoethylphosphonate ABC transporter substrate-binding protein [Mycobacteroides abscessus]RIT70497.1 2-aminoethylphosphonate ABC transporter substrate-binding protein [Mycobacteroides abscessus]SKM01456.1 2-aminoethylphosphonate ABC transporter substrate-binding protein [Mycobacteroides abscessus subsp. massiliense]